jgi:hypothetical protein
MERPVQDVFVPSAEEIEKQKMRLACKMEILGFYDGYRGALCKMTADQNKKLASKQIRTAPQKLLTRDLAARRVEGAI